MSEYSKYLAHHGIKGQKWGQRNGPPYPLGASDHSAAEKKAALENSRKKKLTSKSESDSKEKQAYGSAKKNLENALKNRNDEAGMVDAWKKYSDAHDKYLNSIDPSTLKKVGVGAAVTVGVVGVGAALYLNRDKLGPVLANLPNTARQKLIEGKIDKVGFDFELSNMARKTTSINPSLLPDEDTTLGIDTIFHRMSGDGLLQPENADHDCIFASYKPNDVDLYKMMYPLFDSNNSESNTFKDLTLALKEPVKIPSAKKRFDTYAELLGEKSKAGDAVRNDFLKMIDPEQLAIPGYKDMVAKQIMADPVGYASRHYRLLVSRGNSTRSEGNREFFKRLISKGYNAVTDDCDAGVQADHPVIFMKNIVNVVSSKDVSTKSKDYFEAAYRAVPIDDSDKSLSSLYHHGILGQKWGKRNGPPYPLGASDHSAAERKAAVENSRKKKLGTKNSSDRSGLSLSYNQKKMIKIGAALAGTALVTYGAYKLNQSGFLDKYKDIGKNRVDEILGLKKAGSADFGNSFKSVKPEPKTVGGLKLLSKPESLSESLSKANPLNGTPEGTNNCTNSAIAGFLRMNGYDVIAKGTGGKQQILAGVVEDCFKGAKVFDGSAVKFGKSPEDAAQMLVKRFGENASGCCSIQWKKDSPFKGGHAFNWKIENGSVTFMDFKHARGHDKVKAYWRYINPNDSLTLARLDQADINFDTIKDYIT